MQLLHSLAAEGVIQLTTDASGLAPHGVGSFRVLELEVFKR